MTQEALASIGNHNIDFKTGLMNYPAAELTGYPSESSSVNHSSPHQDARYSGSRIRPGVLAQQFLEPLPLPERSINVPVSALTQAIKYVQRLRDPLIIVSTVCPPYSSDEVGRPTYEGLNTGISPNIKQHFLHIPPAIRRLQQNGVEAIHFFLMADTEVDLLPFLAKLEITPEEFTARCGQSIEAIAAKVVETYGDQIYKDNKLPPAARFLEYFGSEQWFEKYEYFRTRLLSEVQEEPAGRVAEGLNRDLETREVLITKLLGRVSYDEKIAHLARQRAQYMAFSSLMRDRFEERLVVVNHRTPNFAWMNDRITRERTDPVQRANSNYKQPLPLIELDISTLPETI